MLRRCRRFATSSSRSTLARPIVTCWARRTGPLPGCWTSWSGSATQDTAAWACTTRGGRVRSASSNAWPNCAGVGSHPAAGLSTMFRSLTIRDEGEWLALRYGPLPVFRNRQAAAHRVEVGSGQQSAMAPGNPVAQGV